MTQAPIGTPPAPAPQRQPNIVRYQIALVILAVTVGVLAVALLMNGSTPGPATATPSASAPPAGNEAAPGSDPTPPPVDEAEQQAFLLGLPRREDGDPLAKGAVDAPVVMTEWADYRCPYCSVWAEETLPKLQPLIDDGTLRIEFRDLTLFGEDSVRAAVAARAAGEQGRYWEFQAALFAALPNQGQPDVGEDLLIDIATQIGVPDLEAFKTDLRSEELQKQVMADTQEGQGLGITSTPTFLIGTEGLSGAQPLEVFEKIIAAQKEAAATR
ncbi:MAG: DsbA family protein [Propioniciclava sp.]